MGWAASELKVAERSPGMPPPMAMNSDSPPMQCPSAWISSVPVSRLTVSTAAGQSRMAMSSTLNWVKLDGRSGLAR